MPAWVVQRDTRDWKREIGAKGASQGSPHQGRVSGRRFNLWRAGSVLVRVLLNLKQGSSKSSLFGRQSQERSGGWGDDRIQKEVSDLHATPLNPSSLQRTVGTGVRWMSPVTPGRWGL